MRKRSGRRKQVYADIIVRTVFLCLGFALLLELMDWWPLSDHCRVTWAHYGRPEWDGVYEKPLEIGPASCLDFLGEPANADDPIYSVYRDLFIPTEDALEPLPPSMRPRPLSSR
jgi:hypothetical protein